MPIIKNKVQLNERITFVEMKPNDGPEPGEVEEREVFSCWCYIKGNTIRDIREQHGTIYEGTVNFVIRYQQQEEINNKMQIRFHNKLYNIVTINEDSSDKDFTVVMGKLG